jgi:hypothetical protein
MCESACILIFDASPQRHVGIKVTTRASLREMHVSNYQLLIPYIFLKYSSIEVEAIALDFVARDIKGQIDSFGCQICKCHTAFTARSTDLRVH